MEVALWPYALVGDEGQSERVSHCSRLHRRIRNPSFEIVQHGYKYRAVYVVDGVRIVGFDTERGKGDHCHMDGNELPYTFTSEQKVVACPALSHPCTSTCTCRQPNSID